MTFDLDGPTSLIVIIICGEAEDKPEAMAEAGTEEASGVTTATGRIPTPTSEAAAAAAGGAAEDKPKTPA